MSTQVVDDAEVAAREALTMVKDRTPDFRYDDEIQRDEERAMVLATTSIALSLVEITGALNNLATTMENKR